MRTMTMRIRTIAAAITLVFAAGGLVACDDAASGGSGGGSGMTVAVLEPASGAQVKVPFTVRVKAGVPLGPTASGKHHVHIWFDDDADNYLIVESDTTQINAAPPAGKHIMHVSLRNANHSPAGAETTTPVVITGAGSAPTTAPATDDGPGYGY